MSAARRAGLLAAAALATLGARDGAAPTGIGPIESTAVVANYAAALAELRRPKTLSFEYTVEQLGPRNLEQRHRVYRSGLRERDETLVVDGYKLTRPTIRILANRTDRYDVAAIAPKPAGYRFAFVGAQTNAGRTLYTFATHRREPGAFAVSEVTVDGRTFLPATIRFKIEGANAKGTGELQYGRSEAYWLVHQAQVNVKLPHGATAHERIRWTNYQFPLSLPPATFEAPRVTQSPLPALATPAPTPTPVPDVPPL